MDKLRENHIQHVRERLSKLDSTFHDRWPRWTYADYCAVSVLLHIASDEYQPEYLEANEAFVRAFDEWARIAESTNGAKFDALLQVREKLIKAQFGNDPVLMDCVDQENCVELITDSGNVGIAHVSADVQQETVDALKQLIDAAHKAVENGEIKTNARAGLCTCKQSEVTPDCAVHGFLK